MEIDRAYLDATVKNLRQQEQEAVELTAKLRGALVLAEALIARLDEKAPEQTASAS